MPEINPATRTASIETEGLTKQFGETLAVKDLSVQIYQGEIFGFLGPNGAGKTTTIRILTSLIAPSSGSARVAGFDLGREDRQIRRSVGILTETPGLYDQLSAERNLSFFARLYEVKDVPGQVEHYLRMLGLWDRRQESVGTFSKGMRQKLAIARALLHEPRLVFLDEPTSGLDPAAARLVRDFILSLKREGRTIVITTHNLDEADRLCDRIAVFQTRLIALDTPAALRAGLFGRSVVFHLKSLEAPLIRHVETYPFVKSTRVLDNKLVVTLDDPESNNPALVRGLVEAGAEIQFVGELKRSLEDVYLRLVQADGPEALEELEPAGGDHG
ncbi:MAG TPA: ABC transporter ATP-binding protein [Anaerolineales bacterium]|nr:ABC transporter ATP-binding protein [Anaerolineales bacterium]